MSISKNPYWNNDLIERMVDKGFDGYDIHYWMNSYFPNIGEFCIATSIDSSLREERYKIHIRQSAELHILLDYHRGK